MAEVIKNALIVKIGISKVEKSFKKTVLVIWILVTLEM